MGAIVIIMNVVLYTNLHLLYRYEYDRVFSPGSAQEQVFEAVQPLCVSVLDGYNACIFACKYHNVNIYKH